MVGYEVKHERIQIRGVAELHIRSLLDLQQFSDPTGEAALLGISSAFWPLFGVLWPSGQQLAAHMGERPLQAGERILEIGCGLALASLVSHRRGADVTASDCHPLAGGFLAENLRLNELPPMRYCQGDWGPDPALTDAGMTDPRSQVTGHFDLIMGSDVLYERDDEGSLPRFIERHAAPCAEVLIVDPNRGNRAAFTRRMGLMGFTLREHPLTGLLPDGTAYRGKLLQYLRIAPETLAQADHGTH